MAARLDAFGEGGRLAGRACSSDACQVSYDEPTHASEMDALLSISPASRLCS